MIASLRIAPIAQPGLDIRLALGKVRDDVLRETGKRQEPYVYGSLGGEDVALVPARPADPAGPLGAPTAIDLDEALDFRMAERVGSQESWRAFVAAHPSGFYAKLARAQIEKLASAGKAAAPAAPVGSSPKGVGAEAPVGPAIPTTIAAAPTSDDLCKRDEERLVRLRGSPSSEELQRLAGDLGCERLRPQLARLMESLGLPQPALAQRSLPGAASRQPTASAGVASSMADACRREAGELGQIRANPDRGAAERFAKAMTCEALRPQAARLLESLSR